MSRSVLKVGEKIHIITRRLFPQDVNRHFAGEIKEVSDDQVRVEGYVFVYDSGKNAYEKRPEKRVRIFSMSVAGHIVIVIPKKVKIDALHYTFKNGRLVFTDEGDFSLDINEFGPIS